VSICKPEYAASKGAGAMHTGIEHMAAAVGENRNFYDPSVGLLSMIMLPEHRYLPQPDVTSGHRFLAPVMPECRQERGHAPENGSGPVEPKNHVPVHGKLEAFINAANRFPYVPAPEHCLLRYVVGPVDGVTVMERQYPPSDHFLS
jgi:hypothetical protein